jgi:hypothetical protein
VVRTVSTAAPFWCCCRRLQDPNALLIGTQIVPANVATYTTVQDCVTECDYTSWCAGVTIQMTVDRLKIGSTCKLIRGNDKPGEFKRTVVRTELSRVGFPTSFLCPSGYASNSAGSSACIPVNTQEQISFVLSAAGTCDAATIAAVKASVLAYLSSPESAFGVYSPSLIVEVGCLDFSSAQVGCTGGVVQCSPLDATACTEQSYV